MKHIDWKRRKRRRSGRKRPINVLASVLTTCGLYCGIASIFAGIPGQYERAAYFILAAIVFDILDGSVAKMTNSVSEFGKQLDSLSDLVSFGVAPAVLTYNAFIQRAPGDISLVEETAAIVAIIFVICGALRLARYNVYQSGLRDSFIGLPIPAAGGTIATFVLFTSYLDWPVAFWILSPLTLLLAYLMVGSVRYPKDKLKAFVLAPRNAFRILALFGIAIAAVHYASRHSPAIVLFPLSLAYVLFGVGDTMRSAYVRRRSGRRLEEAPAGDQDSVSESGSGDASSPEVSRNTGDRL